MLLIKYEGYNYIEIGCRIAENKYVLFNSDEMTDDYSVPCLNIKPSHWSSLNIDWLNLKIQHERERHSLYNTDPKINTVKSITRKEHREKLRNLIIDVLRDHELDKYKITEY